MEWKSELIAGVQWTGEIVNQEAKEIVAQKIAAHARNGEIIGVGSGSTVYLGLQFLAKRVHFEKLEVAIIAASYETAMSAARLGLRQFLLNEKKPDWSFDGADEIDPEYNLLKGRGGAFFKEKLLICSSPFVYILADETKFVPHLGMHFPVPVEVFPPALSYVEAYIRSLGVTRLALRPAKGKDGAVITESGNFILDVWFDMITPDLEKEIKAIPGVIESGLFMHYPVRII